MKKYIFLWLFGVCCNLTYSQSPITDFTATIHKYSCDYISVKCSGFPANRDSLCLDFGDGNVVWNSNQPQHVYTQPGIYTVTLRFWLNGVETKIVKPDLVAVYNAPTALFNYTVSNSNMFAPLQVNFNNQSVLGDGDSVEYSWFISYVPLSNNTNFSYTFASPGTYLYNNRKLPFSYNHTSFISLLTQNVH